MTDTTKLPVTVIITTYDPGNNSRYQLLLQICESLAKNLKYPNLRYLITDDTRSYEHHLQMCDTTQLYLGEDAEVQYLHTGGKGVGYGKNNALREAFKVSPITLIMEDDWELTQPLDLLPHVQLMLDNPDVGVIRFGYLGGSMDASYVDYGSFLTYWSLKAGSGVYTYSGQVSLRSKMFYDKIGWHAEGIAPGEEELDMCWRYNALPNAPKTLFPACYGTVLNAGPFKNIGLGFSTNGTQPT